MALNSKLETRNLKRFSAIAVGDLIQYRYSYGPRGFTQWGLTTRAVIEVIDHGAGIRGARFKVEGGFIVFANQVILHIPMGSGEAANQNREP